MVFIRSSYSSVQLSHRSFTNHDEMTPLCDMAAELGSNSEGSVDCAATGLSSDDEMQRQHRTRTHGKEVWRCVRCGQSMTPQTDGTRWVKTRPQATAMVPPATARGMGQPRISYPRRRLAKHALLTPAGVPGESSSFSTPPTAMAEEAAAAPPVPELKEESKTASFGGWVKMFSHESEVLKCSMKLAVYLPPQAEDGDVPVVYWLSGLTCTEQNFITKAGAQRAAAKHGFCLVCPGECRAMWGTVWRTVWGTVWRYC